MKCKYKNSEVFDVVQWDYWQTPAGVKQKRRTFIDKALGRPIAVDWNWYVETSQGKVWLHRGDYIVTDTQGNQRVFTEEEFENKFDFISKKAGYIDEK